MKTLIFSALAAALGFSATTASAATATTVMPVSATVLSTCEISAVPLVFGDYSGAQNDASSSLTVLCTPGTAYNVQLDAGGGGGASIVTRKLAFLSNSLDYTLWRDAAYTQNWGTTNGVDTLASTGTGAPQLHSVFGRIPASQFSAPGAYTDVVNVTVEY